MFDNILSLFPNFVYILKGVAVTLEYSFISLLFGLIIGTFLAVCKTLDNKIISGIAYFYSSFFRGTPLLAQLSIIYFGLPALGLKLDVSVAAILAFSLNSGAYISEVMRAGINSVDKGQLEAAKALGIPSSLAIKDIILPQAIRKILPSLVNEWINLIKESALVSVIGGMDIMRRADLVSAETYNRFGPLISAAAIYYVIVLIVSRFGQFLEKRLSQ
jgi:polar amino acid transport system permease protein